MVKKYSNAKLCGQNLKSKEVQIWMDFQEIVWKCCLFSVLTYDLSTKLCYKASFQNQAEQNRGSYLKLGLIYPYFVTIPQILVVVP